MRRRAVEAMHRVSGGPENQLRRLPAASSRSNRDGGSLSYIMSEWHAGHMSEKKPDSKDRSLKKEFWIVTALVAGSFLVGAWNAIQYLLT